MKKKMITFLKGLSKLTNDEVPSVTEYTHKYCSSCKGSGHEDVFFDCNDCKGTGIIEKSFEEINDSIVNPNISEYNKKIAEIESNLEYLKNNHVGNNECSALIESIRLDIMTLALRSIKEN